MLVLSEKTNKKQHQGFSLNQWKDYFYLLKNSTDRFVLKWSDANYNKILFRMLQLVFEAIKMIAGESSLLSDDL